MHTVFFVFICSEGGKLYIPLVLVNDNFFWVGGRAVGGRDFFFIRHNFFFSSVCEDFMCSSTDSTYAIIVNI